MTGDVEQVVVIGAGLAGCCTALELAKRGVEVLLLDQDTQPMSRASLRNEGKIHLGLIYAQDHSFDTARLQLQGALVFRRYLERWLGEAANTLATSEPFTYLVADDSLSGPAQLEQYYAQVEAAYQAMLRDAPALDYLGTKPVKLFKRLQQAELEKHFSLAHIQAGFETAELAIDPAQLAERVRAAVARQPRIRFLAGRRVTELTRQNGEFLVEAGNWSCRAGQLVNATWENRALLDAMLGIEADPELNHRLKYRVIAELPTALRGRPSSTMVLGRYGDVVVRRDGTAYLSWYPSGLRGWHQGARPPAEWDSLCREPASGELASEISNEILNAIDDWFPGIRAAKPLLVDAGAIVAHGTSDVDEASSGLHGRSRIGVVSSAGYHSLDPGKLTTAPLFAMQAAEHVCNAAHGATGRSREGARV